MFDCSFWELALCFIIAHLVLGPERLPGLARTPGTWVAGQQMRKTRQILPFCNLRNPPKNPDAAS